MDSRRYHASPDVESSEAGGRAVLYHRGTGAATILNPTGSFLWKQLLGEGRTAGELAAALCERHPGLAADQALGDTGAFLDRLVKSGLVHTGDAAPVEPRH